mgnify:CR=1 FL=1
MPILKLYYSFLTYLILILVAKLEKISNFALEKKKNALRRKILNVSASDERSKAVKKVIFIKLLI